MANFLYGFQKIESFEPFKIKDIVINLDNINSYQEESWKGRTFCRVDFSNDDSISIDCNLDSLMSRVEITLAP